MICRWHETHPPGGWLLLLLLNDISVVLTLVVSHRLGSLGHGDLSL